MLKIAVFGTGGVGGIFGALFSRAGHQVHFLARGEHLRVMQSKGLRVLGTAGEFEVRPLLASETAKEAAKKSGPFDLVMICVKMGQFESACEAIAPLVTEQTLILPLQNGVEATDILVRKYSRSQILRGFCAVISYIEAPGVIRQMGTDPYLCFGELEAPHVSQRILRLKSELSTPGVGAILETPENLHSLQWQKFLFISSLAGLTSLTRLPVGPLRSCSETREILSEAMTEVVAIANAKGITLRSDAVEFALKQVDQMPESGTTSMQRDFAAQRPTELETFSGYLFREGQRLNVPTPIHRLFYFLLLPQQGGSSQGSARHPG